MDGRGADPCIPGYYWSRALQPGASASGVPLEIADLHESRPRPQPGFSSGRLEFLQFLEFSPKFAAHYLDNLHILRLLCIMSLTERAISSLYDWSRDARKQTTVLL